ncbi:response regulator transcription factor [Egicoccus sp. AB-alg6-2]|uniref:response regulator transcription factor n=1 Tax=Egicoccus sp. AB-alg6-2 TaxID=3242692 RepID=UPI00359D2682
MAKVLAVDDEPQILTAVGRGLSRAGYEVIVARCGEDALTAAAAALPDVVLLDLRLPDLDGIEVVKRLRTWTSIPIVLLSGAGSERARVLALDAGADDFIDKPFSMEELRARLGAILRRAQSAGPTTVQPAVQVGDLQVDLATRRVRVAGSEVKLTPLQWKLLEVLVANDGKLLTYRDIISAVWSDKHGDEARDSLRVHLRALRQKLGDDASAPRYIATESGVGYRWVGADE